MKKEVHRFKVGLSSLLIILIAYLLVLRFIFPQYLTPLVGHHSDMMDYRYDSVGMGFIDYLIAPRPIGQWVLSLVSFGSYKTTMLFGILITFLNVGLLFSLGQQIFNIKGNNYFYKFIYAVLIFAHPGFYINYTFDIYSTISLTFFLILLLKYYKSSSKTQMFSSIILIILCGLSKETYLAAIIIFYAMNTLCIEKRKNDKWMLVISIILTILIIFWNKNIGSTFVAISTNNSDAYYTSFNLISIVKTFWYYVQGWGNIMTIFLFLAITLVAYKGKFMKIVMLILMNLAAYAPYMIMPNHTVPHYRWLGIVFGYLIIFALVDTELFNKFQKQVNIAIGIAVVLILVVNIRFVYKDYYWAIQPEKINVNILKGFDYVREKIEPGDNILIGGLYSTEETPYKALYYIENNIPYECSVSVLTQRETNLSYNNKLININEISQDEMNKYDSIFIYNNEGKIQEHIDLSIQQVDEEKYHQIIDPFMHQISKKDMSLTEALDLGNSYYGAGNSEKATEIFNQAIEISNGENPYPFFFKGIILENEGDYLGAHECYTKAVNLDTTNNYNFTEALTRINKVIE